MTSIHSLCLFLLLAVTHAYSVQPVGVRHARVPTASMFFGRKPKGEPVEVAIKTFDGGVKAKGFAGDNLMKVMGDKSGLVYGCKEGTCGTCEVKLEGRVVRTWCALQRPCAFLSLREPVEPLLTFSSVSHSVAKLPAKATVNVDVTSNSLLKQRRNSNW